MEGMEGYSEDLAASVKAIKSLKGIENFTSLVMIDVDGHDRAMPLLESLDISGLPNLQTLQASDLPNLASLKIGTNSTITTLTCENDPMLCELDVSGCLQLLEETSYFAHDPNLYIITEDNKYAPRFYGKSLMLSGQLGLYFYMKLPVKDGENFDDLYGGSYMAFTIKEGTGASKNLDNVTFNEAEPTEITEYGENVTIYGFRCGVTSAQMADEITPIFHYGEDASITLPNEEGDTEGTVTVSEYLDTLGEFQDFLGVYTFPESIAELANAIKDYGYYAQQALSQQYGDTWNHTEIEAPTEEITVVEADELADYELGETDSNSGLETGYTLVLDSNTTLEVYLSPDNAVTIESATLDGEAYAVGAADANGEYVIKIENIPAHELSQDHKIVVTSSAGSLTISNLSALSYAHRVLSSEEATIGKVDIDTMKQAVTAIYNYFKKTEAYRNSDEFKKYNQ